MEGDDAIEPRLELSDNWEALNLTHTESCPPSRIFGVTWNEVMNEVRRFE